MEFEKSSTDNQVVEPPNVKYFFGEFKTALRWDNIIKLSIIHLLALYSLYTGKGFDYRIFLLCFFHTVMAGFSSTAGVHRLWTHRAYKVKLPLKILLIIGYSMAGMNTIPQWVRDHRIHHKFSETDADPHNSNRGFFFSHMGWLLMKKHPEVIRRGREVDISDITNDPLIRFHTKYFTWFVLFFCFFYTTWIPVHFWNFSWLDSLSITMFRYLYGLHSVWSVNSVAHIWGNKPFDKNIAPAQNKLVSAICMGEGWHNYHHVFPSDYRAAELGQYFNWTTFLIDMFAKIGWAYDFKMASPEFVAKAVLKKGDGTHKSIRNVARSANSS